jgi:hypothetical protein
MQRRPDQPGEALPQEDEGVRRGIVDPNGKKRISQKSIQCREQTKININDIRQQVYKKNAYLE